jgi:hypothetical protein
MVIIVIFPLCLIDKLLLTINLSLSIKHSSYESANIFIIRVIEPKGSSFVWQVCSPMSLIKYCHAINTFWLDS